MNEQTYLTLQPTEGIVAQAAATIFSGYVTSNQVNAENEDMMVEKSVLLAIKIASKTEEQVRTTGEMQ